MLMQNKGPDSLVTFFGHDVILPSLARNQFKII